MSNEVFGKIVSCYKTGSGHFAVKGNDDQIAVLNIYACALSVL